MKTPDSVPKDVKLRVKYKRTVETRRISYPILLQILDMIDTDCISYNTASRCDIPYRCTELAY